MRARLLGYLRVRQAKLKPSESSEYDSAMLTSLYCWYIIRTKGEMACVASYTLFADLS